MWNLFKLVFFSFFSSLPLSIGTTVEQANEENDNDYGTYTYSLAYNEYPEAAASTTGCSVIPVCESMLMQYTLIQPVSSRGCDVWVNCLDMDEFPFSIPLGTTVLYIQSSLFKNLTFDNMKNFTQLDEMVLEFSDLERIEPMTFQNQTRLKDLRFHGNNISDIFPQTFAGLVSLDSLDLSNNELRRLYDGSFHGLGNVTDLSLNLNMLKSLDAHVFSGLSALENLILQQNNISYISPLAFRELLHLKTLNLKLNHLSKIPTKSLKVLPNLLNLYLGKNPIAIIGKSDLKGLRSLRYLWLEECEIRTIAKRAFHGKNLYTLVLEQNLLINFPSLGRMTQLRVLTLDDNPWKCDRNAIPMLRWLQRHDTVDVSVICAAPEQRRGINLLKFSESDLVETNRMPSNIFDTTVKTNVKLTTFPTSTRPPSSHLVALTNKPTQASPLSLLNITEAIFSVNLVNQSWNMKTVNLLENTDVLEISGEKDLNLPTTADEVMRTERTTAFYLDVHSTEPSLFETTKSVKHGSTRQHLNITIIIFIIVAVTLVIVAMVTAVACKVSSRRRRRERFLRRRELPDNLISPAAASRLNDFRLSNGKRRRPMVSEVHLNGDASMNNGNGSVEAKESDKMLQKETVPTTDINDGSSSP